MKDRRNKFTGEFKAKIALEAIKGHRTVSEIAGECGVPPHQITEWKKQAIEGLPHVLSDERRKRTEAPKALVSVLYQQIG